MWVGFLKIISLFQLFMYVTTFKCIMSQNGQTNFKNLASKWCKIFKVYLAILGHYALLGLSICPKIYMPYCCRHNIVRAAFQYLEEFYEGHCCMFTGITNWHKSILTPDPFVILRLQGFLLYIEQCFIRQFIQFYSKQNFNQHIRVIFLQHII